VFVGATRARDMRNIMLVSTFAVFLPAWWLLQGWGNHGLWPRTGSVDLLQAHGLKPAKLIELHDAHGPLHIL
jgi:MATE family multidrug resistance protein